MRRHEGSSSVPDRSGNEESEGKTENEEKFKKEVIKRVRFSVTEGNDKPMAEPWKPSRRFREEASQTRTGAGMMQYIGDGIEKATPNEMPMALTQASLEMAESVEDIKRKPGAAGALLAGGSVQAATSMRSEGGKQQSPNFHPLVEKLLGDYEKTGAEISIGHGKCVEVALISDYLWNVDPSGGMGLPQARYHFEHAGAATASHKTFSQDGGKLEFKTACPTCEWITERLAIVALKEEVIESDFKPPSDSDGESDQP